MESVIIFGVGIIGLFVVINILGSLFGLVLSLPMLWRLSPALVIGSIITFFLLSMAIAGYRWALYGLGVTLFVAWLYWTTKP